jgi:hypothetical protein
MYIVTRNDVVVKSTIVKVRLLLGYSDFPGNLVMNGRESRIDGLLLMDFFQSSRSWFFHGKKVPSVIFEDLDLK